MEKQPGLATLRAFVTLLLSPKGHKKLFLEPGRSFRWSRGLPITAAALGRAMWPLPVCSLKGLVWITCGEEG